MSNFKKKLVVSTSLLAAAAFAYILASQDDGRKHTNQAKAKTVVAITNFKQNSGGTGTIVYSTPAKSLILTNKHVCELIVNGGLIKTSEQKLYGVSTYKMSQVYDLCLLTVDVDLGIRTRLANRSPAEQSGATIVGHPRLYTTATSVGFFSGKQIINVATGVRPCTEEEFRDPELGMYCLFAGGLPIIKRYEAQLVTATIMPGSSGSPIFNEEGELAAVAFAGDSEFGYAFAMPLEAILSFITQDNNPFTSVGNDINAALR